MIEEASNHSLFTYASSIVTSIGFFSYALAALFYAGVALALRFGWWNLPKNNFLWTACLLTSLWSCSVLLLSNYSTPGIFFLVQLLELLRDCSWLALLASIIGFSNSKQNGDYEKQQQSRLMWAALTVALILLVITITQPLLPLDSKLLELDQFLIPLGLMVLSIFGVVFSEQIIRNTPHHERWTVKFFCLSISVLFIYDFLMYSHAVLFKSVQPELWQARGVINSLVIPFLLIGAARNSARPLELSMSRRFVFRTGTLLASSIYLIGISLIGYYFKHFGGSWGFLLQALFLVSAFILLLLMLFSGEARARLNLWISQNFFRYRYDYREEWMRFNNILTDINSSHSIPARALTAVSNIVESSSGVIWYSNSNQNLANKEVTPPKFIPIHGIAIHNPEDLSQQLPEELIQFWQNDSAPNAFKSDNQDKQQRRQSHYREWIINLEEYNDTPLTYEPLKLPEWLSSHPYLWLIIPLFLHDKLVGAIGLGRPRAPLDLNWENYDLLKIAARQACTYLAQDQATQALAKAKQFEAVNQATAFLIHDIKTMIAQLSLLVKNAARHKENPEFIEDMIKTTDHTVKKMTHILEQLRSGEMQKEEQKNIQKERSCCALLPTIEGLIHNHSGSLPAPLLTSSNIDPTLMVPMSVEALESALNHIIQNAKESTPPDGHISITVEKPLESKCTIVRISDTGCGMSPEFIRDKLFSPFDSTKGLSGMGIGAYQSREYINTAGGELTVESEVGHGTTFTVKLPIDLTMETPTDK